MSGVHSLAEGFRSYREWATDPRPRIGFGMDWFDDDTNGGLARSEVCMIQAFSSVGKTTVALNIIRNNPDIPTLMFSMEMSWRQVASRIAAMELGVSTGSLERRLKMGDNVEELQAVADKFRGLVCDDSSGIKLRYASEAFEDATEQLGTSPRLVVWDYLELLGGGGLAGKAEQVDKAMTGIRNWTKDHDTTSIVLHQLSQGTGGFKPMALHDGRYGGYQPADYVVGAYAPRLNPELTADELSKERDAIYFQLLKNRAGAPDPAGKKHRLHPETMRISRYGDLSSQVAPISSWAQRSFYERPEPDLMEAF